MTQQWFGYLAVPILFIGYLPYFVDIYHHKTKPQRASWLIWTVLGIIAFFSQLASGASWSLVFVGVDTLIVLVVFIISISHGTGGVSLRDKISLAMAALGLVLWYLTSEPLVALLIVIGIDAIGMYLTAVKSYQRPKTETTFFWIMSSLAAFSSALAVGNWSFSLLVYPVYLTLADGIVFLIVWSRSRYPGSSPSIGV